MKMPVLTKDPRKTKPWVVRLFGEYDPATGKERRYSKAFARKADALSFQAEKRKAFELGERRDKPDEVKLGDFLHDCLKVSAGEVRAGTQELYRRVAGRLNEHFGKGRALRSITPRDAQLFITGLINKRNGHVGEALGGWAKDATKRYAKSMFKTAVAWGLIPANPFDSIKSKAPDVKDWYRLKGDEFLRLLDAAPDLRRRTLYAVLYTAGLRIGEALSLLWSDIDFEGGQVIVRNREKSAKLPPFYIKAGESRKIPLPEMTIKMLAELHASAPEGVPFVFVDAERWELIQQRWQECRKQGKPWQARYMSNNVIRTFRADVKRAGIKPDKVFVIHTLRKNACQNWADVLPINVVQKLSGHSKAETLIEFYSTVDQQHRDKAAQAIQEVLDRQGQVYAKSTPEADFEVK